MSAVASALPLSPPPSSQPLALTVAGIAALALSAAAAQHGAVQATLVFIGVGFGVALYHAAFGFTGAYTRAFRDGDISGVSAQLIMLGVAIVLFAIVFARGEVFGHRVWGLVAPVNVSLVAGAFIFGIGMQLAGGCASGTLFTAGGGSVRMCIVLVCFCIGCFVGTLHVPWWHELPSAGLYSVGKRHGWLLATIAQAALLVGIYLLLRRLGLRNARPLGFSLASLRETRWLRGPWPLLAGALALALLNFAELLVAGHPWSVTWGFTLWSGKAAVALGFDPSTAPYWARRTGALEGSLLADHTSLTNFGIIIGAFAAAAARGALKPSLAIAPRALLTAVVGGLLLGYGARLAYGCNIGAFFGGVVSSSIHGWVWLVAALAGNWAVIRLRARENPG